MMCMFYNGLIMATHKFIINQFDKSSRKYIDPSIEQGECKIIKKADPEKLAKLHEEKIAIANRQAMRRIKSRR